MLAYTNRFLSYAQLVRTLQEQYMENPSAVKAAQIANLRKRLYLTLSLIHIWKREQYFAVNSKNEVFLETLVRYGNRYQADQAAAANSLFGGENVVDIEGFCK